MTVDLGARATLPRLLDPIVEADPYAFYRTLREVAPLHHDFGTDAYLVSRHADVNACYRNQAFSTQNYEWQLEPVLGRTLLQLEGREHARTRSLVGKHFRGKGLESWIPVISRNGNGILDGGVTSAATTLADKFASGTEIDLLAEFAHYLPVYVIADMLGLPKSDYDRFYYWYTTQSAFGSNYAKDPGVIERGLLATRELREYLAPFVIERRQNPGDDLISVLATAEVDGEMLSDIDVQSHVMHLLNAGSETTDRTIGNLFCHLLSRRELFEAVRDDRSLVLPAISETLRFTPPSQMNGRVTTEDVELHGEVIPAGSFVWLLIASANRDERRFDNPDVYDFRRTDLDHANTFAATGEHFAFGQGRHFCLGAMLAKSELEITVNLLLDRYPDMRLADGFVQVDRGLKMRSPVAVRVRL